MIILWERDYWISRSFLKLIEESRINTLRETLKEEKKISFLIIT